MRPRPGLWGGVGWYDGWFGVSPLPPSINQSTEFSHRDVPVRAEESCRTRAVAAAPPRGAIVLNAVLVGRGRRGERASIDRRKARGAPLLLAAAAAAVVLVVVVARRKKRNSSSVVVAGGLLCIHTQPFLDRILRRRRWKIACVVCVVCAWPVEGSRVLGADCLFCEMCGGSQFRMLSVPLRRSILVLGQ